MYHAEKVCSQERIYVNKPTTHYIPYCVILQRWSFILISVRFDSYTVTTEEEIWVFLVFVIDQILWNAFMLQRTASHNSQKTYIGFSESEILLTTSGLLKTAPFVSVLYDFISFEKTCWPTFHCSTKGDGGSIFHTSTLSWILPELTLQ